MRGSVAAQHTSANPILPRRLVREVRPPRTKHRSSLSAGNYPRPQAFSGVASNLVGRKCKSRPWNAWAQVRRDDPRHVRRPFRRRCGCRCYCSWRRTFTSECGQKCGQSPSPRRPCDAWIRVIQRMCGIKRKYPTGTRTPKPPARTQNPDSTPPYSRAFSITPSRLDHPVLRPSVSISCPQQAI
jgi:hypothetical protein